MFNPQFKAILKRVTQAFVAAFIAAAILTPITKAQDDPPGSADEAVALFNRGQDEHAKGELTRAVGLYDQALKLLPAFPEAQYQKAAALMSLGNSMEAERSLRRAVELRPDWTLALATLGTILVRGDRYDEGEAILNQAIKLDDTSFPAYSALVELRLRTRAQAETLRPLLEKVRGFSSKAKPTAAVWTTRATLENALGDRAAAKASLSRALEIDPDFKPALYTRADIAILENDETLADDIANTLEKLDARSESLVLLKVRIAASAGKLEDARRLLSAVSSPSREARALAEQISAVTTQSLLELEKQLVADPGSSTLFGRLCSGYRAADPTKALEYCRRAFDAEPSNLSHAIGYGAALVQAGRNAEAVVLLRRLVDVVPDNSSVHANLGTALFQLKRYAEAKTEYRWLTARQPRLAAAYYFLAICHDHLGEYMDAAANYNLFIEHADEVKNKLELEKVKIRLPALQKELKRSSDRSDRKNER